MPYSIEYIEEEDGVIVMWEGVVRGPEIIRSYEDRFSPVERLIKTRYIITDYTSVSDFDMSKDDVQTIAHISNSASAHNKHLYGVAIMPGDVGFGVARMFQAYTDDTGWRTKVTRTREEAEEWLLANLDDSLTFGRSL